MSHTKSERQLANLLNNRRSIWIELEGGELWVYVKHGIRLEARRRASTTEQAARIAAELQVERDAAEIVDQSNSTIPTG